MIFGFYEVFQANMIIYGIILGLVAAFTQSLSYIFARKFSSGCTNSNVRLLIASHIIMAIVGAIALPFFWPAIEWEWNWIRPVILCAVYYLVGQGLMFVSLKSAEASKISPLLSIKVVMLAFLTWWLIGTPLNYLQWTGVGLCLIGAFVLNFGGGGISRRAIISVLGACLFYSLSDMNITIMVKTLEGHLSRWDAIFFGVCMTYILCGLICGPFMLVVKESKLSDLKGPAFGFAVTWMIAMVFLFATFSIVGTVYGNILQSMRGIISIRIGVVIARMGHHHIEAHMPRKIFIRRLIAGLIMTAAIVAFGYGDLSSH